MNKRKDEVGDEEEEEDYMSNDFLNQLVDTRPGLVSRSVARKHEVEKKSKQKIEQNNLKIQQTSSNVLEKQNREEALNKSTLDESNKGFNLMLKMGYKKGQALGSQDTKTTHERLIEPIKVEMKSDRGGLGQVDERKRKLDEYKQSKQVKNQTDKQIEDAYRDTKRYKFLFKKLRSNLFKCQKICFQLDSTINGLKKPEIDKWFWPNNIIKEIYQSKETEDSKDEHNKQETKEIVNESEEIREEVIENYKNETKNETINLQAVYNERLDLFLKDEEYKNKISNEEDTDEEENRFPTTSCCQIDKEKENSDIEPNQEEEEDLSEEVITKRIDSICRYLRENYNYCVWCGYKYESNEDLMNNCPGLSQNDHEDYE